MSVAALGLRRLQQWWLERGACTGCV